MYIQTYNYVIWFSFIYSDFKYLLHMTHIYRNICIYFVFFTEYMLLHKYVPTYNFLACFLNAKMQIRMTKERFNLT